MPAISRLFTVNGWSGAVPIFGILIIPQQRYSTGEIVRRILRLNSSGFDLAGGIYYLSNFIAWNSSLVAGRSALASTSK